MCLCPIHLKTGELVPCSRCPDCLKRRVSGWSFRLAQQDKMSLTSYFVTLTYDVSHVPITRSGFMGLYKRDVQLFIKRLRKAHEPYGYTGIHPIKYYAVGEYGTDSWRPHYHLILFNAHLELMYDREELKILSYSDLDGQVPVSCLQWDKGHTTVGKVSCASVGYTLKYVTKPKRIPIHCNDDRLREFSLMSKGLGKSYLSEEVVKYHKNNLEENMHLTLEGGQKIGMPRYYKDKLYSSVERDQLKNHFTELMVMNYYETVKQYNDPVKHMREVKERTAAEFRKQYADWSRRNKI